MSEESNKALTVVGVPKYILVSKVIDASKCRNVLCPGGGSTLKKTQSSQITYRSRQKEKDHKCR